jgi:cobalt transporter subunit CbtA
MSNRLLAIGLFTGLFAGLISAGLQHLLTVPVILAAEVFENAGPARPSHDHAAGAVTAEAAQAPAVQAQENAKAHDHAEGWAPADGIERVAFTTLATVGASTGFALLLVAGMFLSGTRPSLRSGLAWGACFFAAFSLAPALGLPPELPGMTSAAVVPRQIWWLATVLATLAGLWLILRSGSLPAIFAGAALIAAPHLIGAPQPALADISAVPAALSARFAATALIAAAVMWALIGGTAGFIWQRIEQRSAQA